MPEFHSEPEAPATPPRRPSVNRQRRRLYEPLVSAAITGAPTAASTTRLPAPKPEPA